LGKPGGRPDYRVASQSTNVKAGLWPGFHPALTFELNVCLAHCGDADTDAFAHAAQRGQAVTRAKCTSSDIFAY
jgi:hypothetical protein